MSKNAMPKTGGATLPTKNSKDYGTNKEHKQTRHAHDAARHAAGLLHGEREER